MLHCSCIWYAQKNVEKSVSYTQIIMVKTILIFLSLKLFKSEYYGKYKKYQFFCLHNKD